VFASERLKVAGQRDDDESRCADERIRCTLVKPRPDKSAISPAQPACAPLDTAARQAAAYSWVRLLARIYEVLPLLYPRRGSEMRLIAFITAPDAIEAILSHLGEPAKPPPLAARARAPPDPGYEFEQSPAAQRRVILALLGTGQPSTRGAADHDAEHCANATADSRPVRSPSRREGLPWMPPGAHLNTHADTLPPWIRWLRTRNGHWIAYPSDAQASQS
jgi:hypothetical protein